jgi:CheY-like chemotaxis protein
MGGKILIVDDVAINRIVMKVKLTAAGYLPVVAADGASALAFAAAQTPNEKLPWQTLKIVGNQMILSWINGLLFRPVLTPQTLWNELKS